MRPHVCASLRCTARQPLVEITHPSDDLLDVADVPGKRIVETSLMGSVTVREENATAALRGDDQVAIDPHWLVYLPPTMSPTEASSQPGMLEHPDESSPRAWPATSHPSRSASARKGSWSPSPSTVSRRLMSMTLARLPVHR